MEEKYWHDGDAAAPSGDFKDPSGWLSGGIGANFGTHFSVDDDEEVDPAICAYISFRNDEEQENTGFLNKADVDANREGWERIMNWFIAYPDYFVDIITPKASHFHLFFFQRRILRARSRCVAVFDTFSRGTSKSFLADLNRYLTCMFIPRHNTTITAGTNKQAAEIAKQKIVDDLWVKFPFLANERQKRKIAGKLLDAYKMGNDYVEFNFKNGSSLGLGNVRGLRKESIIFEEIIQQNATKVNEVYIPLLNKPRALYNGLYNPNEPQSQQIYITTAGYQNTFSYDKRIEIRCREYLEPDKYCVLAGTYRIPLSLGLTAQKQIEDVLNSPTFTKSSFEREYESVWSDAPVGAAFSPALVSSLRVVKLVELKDKLTDVQKEKGCFYVGCADMAKDGSADTAVGIAKVTPTDSQFTYRFVNLFKVKSTDFMVVANTFKKAIAAYNLKLFIYDANGVGAGLRDWLNKETRDTFDGTLLPGYGIINPPDTSKKDLLFYPNSRNIIYEIKSGGQIGEHIHWFFFSRMSTNAITFPIKFNEALELYSKNKYFMQMSMKKREQYLLPFKTMDLMEAELKNLDVRSGGQKENCNTIDRLKIVRRNLSVQKDFFSRAEYLVYGTSQRFEAEYYKRHRNERQRRQLLFID